MPKSAKIIEKKNRKAPPRKVSITYLVMALLAATAVAAIVVFKNRNARQNAPVAHHVNKTDTHNGESAMMVNPVSAPSATPENMVWIPGGTFQMGCDDCDMPDAMPVHT